MLDLHIAVLQPRTIVARRISHQLSSSFPVHCLARRLSASSMEHYARRQVREVIMTVNTAKRGTVRLGEIESCEAMAQVFRSVSLNGKSQTRA